ncbi:MAG: hydroxymethylpyrimidine/phosphomethylpyrimidine kinase, partial [Hyphomicrobiaceae bacterium]|nr:hydroxymethylpyrimidine/phosphomethylpyrimidine kinase [Hyphomicrobiaceae bacterium]
MTGMHEKAPPGGEASQGTKIDGRVLVVAGSDSSGGAGIQADIKAITALGGYAMTAVTALTAQNTEGVNGIVETTGGFVAKQMRLALKDIGADVIKIGMVPNEETIESVHYTYREFAPEIPIVLDPVMMAKGGHPLIDREAIHLVRQHFLLHAHIATPNIAEVEVLTGMEIRSLNDMKHAAEIMIT